MIENKAEYKKALEDLVFLQNWLDRLLKQHPRGGKGMTKAGVRKMMARIHGELAVYEAELDVAAKQRALRT